MQFFLSLLMAGFCFAQDSTQNSAQHPTVFRLHILSEPSTLNPLQQKSSSGSFLFTSLHASMLWFENGELHPWLGQCTQKNPVTIICTVNGGAKFSNGLPILAEHFKNTFVKFLNSQKPGLRVDYLLQIKNAEKILSGQLDSGLLGVESHGRILTIHLEKPDSEFIYNLAEPIFAPSFYLSNSDNFMNAQSVFSGPYVIDTWLAKQKVILKPNPYYLRKNNNSNPPKIEFYFITEDTVALNLYEKNKLDFLRRLPTLYIPKFRDRADFHMIDQIRFDYLAFGPKLFNKLNVRKSLAESLNYSELQNLFWSKPRPGCSGLPLYLLPDPVCVDFKISKEDDSLNPDFKNLHLYYSKLGGDDIDRSVQWLQSQWKLHLNIEVQLMQFDNKVLVDKLENNPPELFHRGINISRPSCLDIAKGFLPQAKDNLIQLNSPEYNKIVKYFLLAQTAEQKKMSCESVMKYLIQNYLLIPTGPEYFSVLVNSKWKNWHLNELNQLNLSEILLSEGSK